MLIAENKGETRQVRAHQKFIIDGIKRQAGTLEKAILEGVMNSIEAGSKVVEITLDTTEDEDHPILRIRDWGRGFCSRQEIEDWFETFGTPHQESEGKIWAQFRMGRGQLFSFGRNEWRTGQFRMVYDIETEPEQRDYPSKDVLDYYLQDELDHYEGCLIEIKLYRNPVGYGCQYASVEAMKSAIKKQIEFMNGDILFNGEKLNTPASLLKWDLEDENAHYLFGKGQDLTFYNLGARVMQWSASYAGITGVVVSKKQLKVNFARNDILIDQCEVFKAIQEVVRANRVKKIRKARRQLDRNERISMLVDLRDGRIDYSEVASLGLVPLTNDRVMSLHDIRNIRQHWSFAYHGDQIADRLLWDDAAICFDNEILDELDFNGEPQDFFVWLIRGAFNNGCRVDERNWHPMRLMYRDFNELSKRFNSSKTIISQEKLSKSEKRLLRALQKYGSSFKNRTIVIGRCNTALAWTDGQTYIALSREYLDRIGVNYHSCAHLIATLLHEVAHDDSTEESHHHGFEFYKSFHDIVSGSDSMCSSPMGIAIELVHILRKMRQEEKVEVVIKRQVRKKEQLDRALGITKVGGVVACRRRNKRY